MASYAYKPIPMKALIPSLIALNLLLLTACRKDKEEEVIDLDYTSATDNARAEDAFSDMLMQVDKAVDDNGLRELCDPTVNFDTTSSPRTMTLDFGAENCTASNGRLRRGRILVSYTGRYRDQGTVITITPQNYYVNNNRVEGTKTVTNLGPNPDGDVEFSVSVNGTLTAADGSWTASHTAQRTRTWIAGDDTPALSDDVYLTTGSGSGVNRNGVAYTVSITNALRIALNCPFITQGTVQVIPGALPARIIDYGSGACDANFSVTVNGQTFNVVIG